MLSAESLCLAGLCSEPSVLVVSSPLRSSAIGSMGALVSGSWGRRKEKGSREEGE